MLIRLRYRYLATETEAVVPGPVVIGRRIARGKAPDLDLAPDESVSRRHARLGCDEQGFWIEDLGSRHGTLIGGRRIASRTRLAAGEPVTVGDTTLWVLAPSQALVPEPDPQRVHAREVRVAANCRPSMSLALLHGGVPVVRSLTATNDGERDIDALTLRFSLPPFLRSEVARLVDIGAGETVALDRLPAVAVDHARLAELTEPVQVMLEVEADGAQAVVDPPAPVTVLPASAWHVTGPAQLLACFVQKQSPAVQAIVRRARAPLRALACGVQGFEDLDTSNGEGVATAARALYACLQEQHHITYAREPRYYGADWQVVRTPEAVLDTLEGTCVDLALLFAAVLENRHLAPVLVVVTTGRDARSGFEVLHVLAGVWREHRPPTAAVWTDGAEVLSRLDGSLLLLDPVGFTRGTSGDRLFRQAVQQARACIEDAVAGRNGRGFVHAVDVVAAREQGVHPLALRSGAGMDERAARAVARARREAAQLGSGAVSARHLLVGLLELDEPVLATVLRATGGIDVAVVADAARRSTKRGAPRPLTAETTDFRRVLAAAERLTEARAGWLVHEQELALALLQTPSRVHELLARFGISADTCAATLERQLDSEHVDSHLGSALRDLPDSDAH